jgi:hypothetical protein
MFLAPGPGALLLAAAPAAVDRWGASPLALSLSKSEELRDRAAAILRDAGYQATLPRGPVPRALDLPLGWLDVLLRVLLWGALAALAVLAVAWLARRLRGAPADVLLEEGAPAAPVAIQAESAEALAEAGRFADAIHALLLDTLEALSRAARLAPSLTSREIVAGARLPAPAREALEGLVLAVERSRFGGAAAGAEDYRACLGRFHAFLESYRGPT